MNQLDDSNELPTIEHKLEVEPVTRPMEQPLEQAKDPMGNKNDDGEKYTEGGEGHKQFREEEFNSNKECLTCQFPFTHSVHREALAKKRQKSRQCPLWATPPLNG